MIEHGEALHIYSSIWLVIIIISGTAWWMRSVSKEDNKKRPD